MTGPVLLCFAHRGEAQVFLSSLSLKQQQDVFFNSYFSEEVHILITGEGPYGALPVLMAYLQKYGGHFKKIINFGIVAGIDASSKVGQGFWIQSAYLEQENLDFNYHSYPCEVPKDAQNVKKVLTVHRRVLSAEVAAELSPVAELVDREIWGLAMAAHFYKIPLMSYKVVSDQPKIEKEEFCHRIREKSLEFSQMFFDEYRKINSQEIEKTKEPSKESKFFPSDILSDPLFHFSMTQKYRFQNLFQKMQRREKFAFKAFVAEQKSALSILKMRPKDRARELLQNLENQLNPLWTQMKSELEMDLILLSNEEIDLHQDVTLESELCEVSFEFTTSENLDRKIEALKNFSKTDFWKKRQGQFRDL